MSHSQLPSIDLGLREKLKNRTYRHAFFLSESSSLIAKQLIALRKRRDLKQAQVADALETGQPAISRVERADYRNWSFNTLRRLAELYDARIRVLIEASEDVLPEYETEGAVEVLELVPKTDDFQALLNKLFPSRGSPKQPDHLETMGESEKPSAATAKIEDKQQPQPSLAELRFERDKDRPKRPKRILEIEGTGAACN